MDSEVKFGPFDDKTSLEPRESGNSDATATEQLDERKQSKTIDIKSVLCFYPESMNMF
jgi:hypothetical protein